MLDKLLFLLALAGIAVVFADVLVREGMLLAPARRWLHAWYRKPYRPIAYTTDPEQPGLGPIRCLGPETSKELGDQWWWPPLWGCYVCVAGQWGFWGYLGYIVRHLPAGPAPWLSRYWLAYSPFEHIAFTAFTIITAIILHKWTSES